MQHTIQDELRWVLVFVAAIWAVFALECILPGDWLAYGVQPRTMTGLSGVVTMPFLHANLSHIVSNTAPLFVLLMLLAGSRANSAVVVAVIVVAGGTLLWVAGRPAVHVGASGLVFGLMAFLIVSGMLERRLTSLAIALLVIVLYGGSLWSGILPRVSSHVSWDGHLCGALAGGAVAFALTRTKAARVVES